MKDILVEFTDHGAIVHKDPSVIAAKRDLPYCFFNPELSKVAGVSPSYWVCNEDKEIVPASPEERKRRDEYHHNKPPENTVSLKQTMDQVLDEVYADLEKDIDEVQAKIEDLKCVDDQIINTFKCQIDDANMSINFISKHFSDFKESTKAKLLELQEQNKILKIALIINVILTIILKVV